MTVKITRRSFIQALGAAAVAPIAEARPVRPRPFVFSARGAGGLWDPGDKLAMMNSDGTGFRVFNFHRPNELGLNYVYAFFRDGRHALTFSIEKSEDWKTKPFSEYYPKSRTHIWICDLWTGKLTEIATKNRLAPWYGPSGIVPGDRRMLVSVNQNSREVLYSMNLDGTDPVRLTRPDEYAYGLSISHDGKRLAFHGDYRIFTMGIDGKNRTEVAGRKGWIYFGPSWSPDDQWLVFQVCNEADMPSHDWSDIWIGRPDGSENIPLTEGYAAWFGAAYGSKEHPGSGSNMPRWAADGSGILYARRLPGSVPPWQWAPNRPNNDHFNRDFRPEEARGGTGICFLDARARKSTSITHSQPPTWDFRAVWSPDSKQILFCRAPVGENPTIWVVDRDGRNERKLTDGTGNGADFPCWVPIRR